MIPTTLSLFMAPLIDMFIAKCLALSVMKPVFM